MPRIRRVTQAIGALACVALAGMLQAQPAAQPVPPVPTQPVQPPQPVPAQPAPQKPLDAETVQKWVAMLGDPNFRTRERAQQRLERAGQTAITLLIEALANTGDSEVAFRLQRALVNIPQDLILLCANLSHPSSRVRMYAEESIVMRFITETPRQNSPYGYGPRYYYEDRQRRQPVLPNLRQPFGDSVTGTPHVLLSQLAEQAPILVLPSAMEKPGYFYQAFTFNRPHTINAETLARELGAQFGLTVFELILGAERVAVVTSAENARKGAPAERDVLCQMCAAVLHDLPEARDSALGILGRVYGSKAEILAMMASSARVPGNPCFEGLVRALVLSGQPMAAAWPDMPEDIVPLVAKLVDAGGWYSRQAAIRALMSWAPAGDPAKFAPSDAQKRDRFLKLAWPALDFAADAPMLSRYLKTWALGAAQPLVSDAAAISAVTQKLGAVLEKETNTDLLRQTLLTLLRYAPKPAPAVDKVLDLGLSTTETDLRDAAMEYLRRAASAEFYAKLIARFDAAKKREEKVFLAAILSEARSNDVLLKLVEKLSAETDAEISLRLSRAFTKDLTDPAFWPVFEKLLTHDDKRQRQLGKRLVLATNLPEAETKIRALLTAAAVAERQLELRVVLFRMGAANIGEQLVEMLSSADQALANEAAIGLGEAATDESLKILADNAKSEKETVRLAVLNGLDALGRACAETGDADKAYAGYQLVLSFVGDASQAVKSQFQKVRNNYTSNNGYRVMAQRIRQEQAVAAQGGPGRGRAAPFDPAPRKPAQIDKFAEADPGDHNEGAEENPR